MFREIPLVFLLVVCTGFLGCVSLWFVGYVSFVVDVGIGVVEHLVLVLRDVPAMGGWFMPLLVFIMEFSREYFPGKALS